MTNMSVEKVVEVLNGIIRYYDHGGLHGPGECDALTLAIAILSRIDEGKIEEIMGLNIQCYPADEDKAAHAITTYLLEGK